MTCRCYVVTLLVAVNALGKIHTRDLLHQLQPQLLPLALRKCYCTVARTTWQVAGLAGSNNRCFQSSSLH
jgi:hypothetical protein